MTARIKWNDTPRAAIPADPFGWIGLPVGLGQPPTSCPTATSPDAQQKYANCRATAYNKAANVDCASWPDPATKGECIQANFFQNFNAADCFKFCAENCTAAGPIKVAQEALGRPVTGVWTQADQQAMQAANLTFLDLAPGCKGNPPQPIGGQPQPPPPPPPPPPTTSSGGGWGAALLAAAGIALLAVSSS